MMKRKMGAGASQDGRIENLRLVLDNIRSYLKRRKRNPEVETVEIFKMVYHCFYFFLKQLGIIYLL